MLAAVFALAGCRQDMQNQPKFIPLRSNDFFADQRSGRNPIRGTVPRLGKDDPVDMEQLEPASYYLTGKRGAAYGDELPFPLTHAVMDRGQERYNIYCAPCHARVGDGNGMIVQRGFKHPPSFHQQRLRNAPVGYFYEIISNGLGAMPDYASQIKPEDRWDIAAYIRALQGSQNASEADVPADKLKAPNQRGITIPSNSRPSPKALDTQGEVKP
jgi:cytochrome c553